MDPSSRRIRHRTRDRHLARPAGRKAKAPKASTRPTHMPPPPPPPPPDPTAHQAMATIYSVAEPTAKHVLRFDQCCFCEANKYPGTKKKFLRRPEPEDIPPKSVGKFDFG